jgi:hypothetical protein
MSLKRRTTGWLALLAVLIYGLAPFFAGLRPAGAAPLVCLTGEVHSCSCRLDPHTAQECCCGEGESGKSCSVSRMPCDAGSAPEAAFPAPANPLQLPNASLRLARPASRRVTTASNTVLCVSRIEAPPTPPPQL